MKRLLAICLIASAFAACSGDLRIFAGIITALLLPTLVSVIACVIL